MNDILTHKLACGTHLGMFRCGVTHAAAQSVNRDFVTSQYAMNYIHEGSGYYLESNGVSHPLKKGSVLRRFPNVKHSFGWSSQAEFGVVALPAQALELLQLTGLARSRRPVFEIEPDDGLLERFSELGCELANAPEYDFSHVFIAMLDLMTDLHKREIKSSVQPYDSKIIQAMTRLSSNVAERLTIPQLAEELGMGYSSFRKTFKKQVGMSPGAFQMQRRIEKSLNLLANGENSISEIADQLGYPDIYTFSSQFKRIMSYSPLTWRKVNRL